MTDHTWIGGGNNRADNPDNWLPASVPGPDDNIAMSQGTMNIDAFALGPSPLETKGNVTINLSHGGTASGALVVFSDTATINVQDTSNFRLETLEPGGIAGSLGLPEGGSAIVDLRANSKWIGGFSVFGGSLVINGLDSASFVQSTESGVTGTGIHAVINAGVGAGTGTIDSLFGATLEVGGSVAAGQIVRVIGNSTMPTFLQVDHPNLFAGKVDLNSGGQIDLEGLTKADSYTFQDDMISIFAGGKVIDTLHLTDSTPNGFAVEQTADSVDIVAVSDPTNAPKGLPTHMAPPIPPWQSYTGPVSGIEWQLIEITPDNLNIASPVPNVFIHTGGGMDAIDVSGVNGTNVLDGSTGTNFLSGGTGKDTFYVDDRNAKVDIFTTVKNFHADDDATVWGITPADFKIATGDNVLPSAPGLDFAFTAPGKPNANINIPGYSTADLGNGRLSLSFGRTLDLSGLPGSDYMLIHANR